MCTFPFWSGVLWDMDRWFVGLVRSFVVFRLPLIPAVPTDKWRCPPPLHFRWYAVPSLPPEIARRRSLPAGRWCPAMTSIYISVASASTPRSRTSLSGGTCAHLLPPFTTPSQPDKVTRSAPRRNHTMKIAALTNWLNLLIWINNYLYGESNNLTTKRVILGYDKLWSLVGWNVIDRRTSSCQISKVPSLIKFIGLSLTIITTDILLSSFYVSCSE